MLNFTATVKLAESSEGSISQAGVLLGLRSQPRGLPKESSLHGGAQSLLLIIYYLFSLNL